MFNFGSFISLSKNLLIIACVALVIYGISLLTKLILTKTKHEKLWINWIGKYWTVFVFVLAGCVYWILGTVKNIDSSFVNAIMNSALLTGLQSMMYKIINVIVNYFSLKGVE